MKTEKAGGVRSGGVVRPVEVLFYKLKTVIDAEVIDAVAIVTVVSFGWWKYC